MTNVIQFSERLASQPTSVDIDVTVLAWVPLPELREQLWAWPSQCSSDPLLLRKVVRIVAAGLVRAQRTDAEARTEGWHSSAAMRERGVDMLLLLSEDGLSNAFPGPVSCATFDSPNTLN